MNADQEKEITKQIAKVYGFQIIGKGYKCSKCGTTYRSGWSITLGGMNERIINHDCSTSILGRGSVSSSRN